MRKHRMLTLMATLVFIFLSLPLLIIVVTSFGEAEIIQFPIHGFTLDWYGVVFASEAFMSSMKLSLIVGLMATVLALLVGIPISYVLARYPIKGKNMFRDFFLSPLFIPGIVVGYVLFQFIVVQLRIPIFIGLLIGHFLISVPYIIRVVGSSMQQLDTSIEEVAWTLGCGRLRCFIQIVLPNIFTGIFAAFMLAFVNSFNNIPVSMFLSGPGVTTLPTALLSYMEYNYDPSVSAISVILMVITIGLMVVIEKTMGLASIS